MLAEERLVLELAADTPPGVDNLRCQQCKLHLACATPFMPTSGPIKARYFFVGSAVDRQEDYSGQMFTGQAGKLLKKYILAPLGLTSEDVAFQNSVRCFPSNKAGKPTAAQVAMCSAFLWQDLSVYKPDLIVALGGDAARGVFGKEVVVKDATYKLHLARDIPVYVTYSLGAAFFKSDFFYVVAKAIANYLGKVVTWKIPAWPGIEQK